MVSEQTNLAELLQEAIDPTFRNRLLDRGVARGLIWRNGSLPDGAPNFADSLTEDLLDYACSVMSMALRLRSIEQNDQTARQALLVAGECIQAAVHRGDANSPDQGFHRVSAAVAFYLAGYSAMAYSIVPVNASESNLAPTEAALVHLFRRNLEQMRLLFSSWLRNENNLDEAVSVRLSEDPDFDRDDAVHLLITTSFMRALALFDHAVSIGDSESAESAGNLLRTAADVAGQLNFVSHWWTCTLASHLIDDLWGLSLHQGVPTLPVDDPDHAAWNELRLSYIQRLLAIDRPTIELWPSQIDAAARSTDQTDNLVVALPTSSGKTRIAELCILRTLASGRRVVYVTPLRALSAQVERDLAQTFRPMGYSVSSLYGSVDIDSGDGETLRQGNVVVSTPEKLSFALKNDHTLIDDVGLVVLDEGHTLGPSEREVRYEVLVESLLAREDSKERRLVSLSALFPTPDEMTEIVAWLRQDEPGDPIHLDWRPTRQRFGTIQWMGNAGRLDISVGEQSSFVPRFVEPVAPPTGSRRRTSFPRDKPEFTLAAAWRFASDGQRVFVYCPQRRSVDSLGRLVLDCIRQGVITPLRSVDASIQDAINVGIEWLGEAHPAVRCLAHGVALHHGGLPRAFANEIERLLRTDACPLVIASPTLAQGLNLSASVLLVHSIYRNREIIKATEFANVAGRAGRAFIDVEALVLHVIRVENPRRRRYAVRQWHALVQASRSMDVVSGLLDLTVQICERISDRAQVPFNEVLEHVTGNEAVWEYDPAYDTENEISESDWEGDIAALDSALLSLLTPESELVEIDSNLGQALEGSLFSRMLLHRSQEDRTTLPGFLAERARYIWLNTSVGQRQGYHSAGVGYKAGAFLDASSFELVSLLLEAEEAIASQNVSALTGAVVRFAETVLQVNPFRPRRDMPAQWQSALTAWLEGEPAAAVLAMLDDGGDGVNFLQEIISYRLPWAMEAVRIQGLAVGTLGASELKGQVPMVTESGSSDLSVNALIRCGFRSRQGAHRAVETTAASFEDRTGMESWLMSRDVESRRHDPDWPSAQARREWEQFYERERQRGGRTWIREFVQFAVDWRDEIPESGTDIVLDLSSSNEEATVLSPDYYELGSIQGPINRPINHIVRARTGDEPNTIDVEFFGPSRNAP